MYLLAKGLIALVRFDNIGDNLDAFVQLLVSDDQWR